MAGAHVGVGPLGQGPKVKAIEPASQQAPRDDQRIEPRLREVAAGDTESLVVEKPEVERRIVRDHDVVADERHETLERLLDARLADQQGIRDTGDAGDRQGNRLARIDQGFEPVDDLAALQTDRRDLCDLGAARRSSGRLDVEDAERGLVHGRRRPPRRRQPDQVPLTPCQTLVALDDLGHEPPLQAFGTRAHPQDLRDDMPRLERTAATYQQITQFVGERGLTFAARLGQRKRELELEVIGRQAHRC